MSSTAARAYGCQLYERWTSFWNLALDLAPRILAPRLVLRYAQPGTEPMDRATTPEDLVAVVRAWHDKRKAIRFAAVGETVVDLEPDSESFSGLIAQPYEVSFDLEDAGKVAFGGTDTLRVARGKISEVWSVSAGPNGRLFYRELRVAGRSASEAVGRAPDAS